MNDGAKQASFTISNSTGGVISVDGMVMTWNPAANKNGALLNISLNGSGNVIYGTTNSSGSLDIPGVDSWTGGTRIINNGVNPVLLFVFDKGSADTGTITITIYNSVTAGNCVNTIN